MSEPPPAAPKGRHRRRELKRSMMAGDELAFSPVHISGDKVLSHTSGPDITF